MEWLRDWTINLAGLVVLFAALEIILPRGDMKKYVQLAMGLVLIIAVVKPIANFSAGSIGYLESSERQTAAAELKNRLNEKERFCVMKVYREKICESIKNEITAENGEHIEVKAEIEENDEKRFGEVNGVTVIVYSDRAVNSDEIRQTVNRKFGVDRENIRIISAKEEG